MAGCMMLVYLGLSECRLHQLDSVYLPNLLYLNVSENLLVHVNPDIFFQLRNLRVLTLSRNPLGSDFLPDSDHRHKSFPSLKTLDLSKVSLSKLNASMLNIFPNLQVLNLSGSGLDRIVDRGFSTLHHLNILDMTGCALTYFPRNVIKGLQNLQEVRSSNYKLCCTATLPVNFNPENCHAPTDEISSCDNLLRSDVYRVMLSLFATLSLVGNAGSVVYRVIIHRVRSDRGFGVFVTHLSVSDFCMGLYLAIIGIADRVHKRSYVWDDVHWRFSTACHVAGFLSMMSNEMSAFIICLITLDRFLALQFPFSRLHFRYKSAHVVCVIVWCIGIALAGVPLLSLTSHWQFYSQNGICIPLPITQKSFPGHFYSFSVVIVLNLVLFLLIAAGQISIYYSVKLNSMTPSGMTGSSSRDVTIARRLITIAMTDFLCWFPIGLLGLLASRGIPVPGEANVAMAVLILPLNSVLNPFLYTFNTIQERRRRKKEERLIRILMSAKTT